MISYEEFQTKTRNKDRLHDISQLQAEFSKIVFPTNKGRWKQELETRITYIILVCYKLLRGFSFYHQECWQMQIILEMQNKFVVHFANSRFPVALFTLYQDTKMRLCQPQYSKLFLVFADSNHPKNWVRFHLCIGQSLSSNWIGPTYKNVVNPSKRKSICWVAALDQCLKQVTKVMRARWLLILTLSTQ